jgi:hypothetical protein
MGEAISARLDLRRSDQSQFISAPLAGDSMRIFWTLFKVILGLAIAIPLGIMALALTAGLVGTLVALAMMALRLAVIALVGYGVFRVARLMFGSRPRRTVPRVPELPPPVDPYYEAAMRELDAEMGRQTR